MRIETSNRGARARAAAREALVFLLFLLLSIAMTWPLARHMDRALSDPGDPYLNAWILDWVQHATLQWKPIWDAPIFHPSPLALTFSENMLLVGWILLPARLFGADPVAIYNLATILGFALAGYGGYVMVRAALGSLLPALAGGIFFAFVPYRFDQLAHLQHIWAGFLTLLLAAAIHYVRRPGWRSGILLGAAFLANALTNLHWLVFGTVALAAALLVGALIDRRWKEIRFWAPAGVSLAVAMALLLPMLHAYSEAKKIHDLRRTREEVRFFSATIEDWLVPVGRTSFYEEMPGRRFRLPERALFPGFLVVLLSVAGLIAVRREELPPPPPTGGDETSPRPLPPAAAHAIDLLIAAALVAVAARADVTPIVESNRLSVDFESRLTLAAFALLGFRLLTLRSWAPLRWARRRFSSGIWIAICLIPMGVLGSFGLNSWFHGFLYEVFSQFRGIRVPARWAVIAYAGLAITAALALHVMRRWPRRQATAAGVAVLLLLLVELHPGRIRWFLVQPERPEVYRWLETAPFRGAVLELPMDRPWTEMAHVFNATAHHRPLVNGFSGYDPLPHRELAAASSSNPVDPTFLGRLESIGTSVIVVHGDLIEKGGDEPIRAWLREGIRSGRITFVKQFDSLIQGTWVFALTRNEPFAATWRDPELGDPAGRTPLQNLGIFLEGEGFVMMQGVTGFIDVLEQNRGRDALRVAGWAASPAGIESVELLFDHGDVAHRVEFGTNLHIERNLPWYAGGKVVSFDQAFERWPKGVHLETDLVVRITDREGGVRHLEQRWLDRERPDP
jgi:hypothetical protein